MSNNLENNESLREFKRSILIGGEVKFDFRQDINKERKGQWVELEGKRIFDVVV